MAGRRPTWIVRPPERKIHDADLHDFQQRHFPVSGSSITAGQPDETTYTQLRQASLVVQHTEEDDVEDDGLGYYHDGAKRTLTDNQISMFRHSEIYSLIRKRQVLKENREADGARNTSLAGEGFPPVDVGHPSEEAGEIYHFSHHGDGTGLAENTATKKRKKSHDGEHTRYSATSRGRVRELDSVAADVGILDYGEEMGTGREGKHAAVEETPSRTQIDYADYEGQDAPVERERIDSPKQGRKIWWPTIG
ncbi:MAG: hypothetical protein Q9225_001438 [Loekoesia sp. 1 TL-2023]